jgi:hypothetical protein
MLQKGSLPITGQVQIEFNETQWDMLCKRLINEFPIDVIILFPDEPSMSKKKIAVIAQKTIRPGTFISVTHTGAGEISNALDQPTVTGLARAQYYFMDNLIVKNSWILFGKIQGDNPVPIIILFNPILNMGTYSFKKKEETSESFNAQLN